MFYKRQYIEWQDRGTSSGAPVAIHEADSDIISQTTRGKDYKDRLPNGNYLDNTANHFVLVLGDNPTTALISMKSTQLKVSRKWNSMMMGIKMQGKMDCLLRQHTATFINYQPFRCLTTKEHGLVGM